MRFPTYIVAACISWFEVVWFWMCVWICRAPSWPPCSSPGTSLVSATRQNNKWWGNMSAALREQRRTGWHAICLLPSLRTCRRARTRAHSRLRGGGVTASRKPGSLFVTGRFLRRLRLLCRSGCSEPCRMMTVDDDFRRFWPETLNRFHIFIIFHFKLCISGQILDGELLLLFL